MAAESALGAGVEVAVFEGMASCGRKFLLAGKGGLNLTHNEHRERFLGRYAPFSAALDAAVRAFDADAVRAWAATLGIATFVGSSGRVFPTDLKAAPLLRRWLQRLRAGGVQFHLRHRWQGWDANGALRFATPAGTLAIDADASVLALGGASWPELGADGAWVELLTAHGIDIAPLTPANCGFDLGWSEHLLMRWAGAAIKPVVVSGADRDGRPWAARGEFMLTATGIEGGVIYAVARDLRLAIEAASSATLMVDLAPDRTLERLIQDLARPRGKHTLAHQLARRAGLAGAKVALLRELCPAEIWTDPQRLAQAIKALPLCLHAPRPLSEAISSAGGVRFAALDQFMVRARPGVFCAGEMHDWEAPTGGYLLSACVASGRAAGQAARAWALARARPEPESVSSAALFR